MKKPLAAGFALVLVFSLLYSGSSGARSFGSIHVYSDGTLSPSDAPIHVEGNVYRLLEDVYNSPIVLERNHMVFDGNGYTLEGASQLVALNVTCSDVTVKNLKVLNWDAGILGAYNNVTVQNCNVTGCGKGIATYADDFRVLGNFLADNEWGIRLQGSNVVISNNTLVGNSVGVWLTSYYGGHSGVVIADNTFKTLGKFALETDLDGGFQVYHNNFIVPNSQSAMIVTAYLAIPGDETQVVMSSWDNGVEGNYWSNYAQKYPNASELGSTGIYDTAYAVNVAPNLTDRYPLVREVDVPEVVLPIPSPTSSPMSSPTITPSSSPTQEPSALPSLTATATSSATEQPSSSPQPSGNTPIELSAALGLAVAAALVAVALLIYRRSRKTV